MSCFKRWFRVAFGGLLLLLVAQAVHAAQPQLNGKWEFTLDYASGYYILPVPMTLTVEGEKVTGTHGEETFEGTFRDGKLELSGSLYVPAAGYASVLEISGVLEGDQIKGKGSWDGYALAIVGKRAK